MARRRVPRPSRSVAGALVLLGVLALLLGVSRWSMVRDGPHRPTNGAMLHPFGWAVDYQSCGFHTGQDWFAPIGTPVYAIEDALVVYVGPLWVTGPDVGRGDYSMILLHEEGGYYTTYSHTSVALVTAGERVARGQKIGEVGNEGFSGNPHLHLEKVVVPFTGNWEHPFEGCDGYVDPGGEWSPF